jgi:hypothetical protein
MAKENPKLALTKIQDAIEFGDYFGEPANSDEI